MNRKIFLSFLGTSFYHETNYITEGQKEEDVQPTRFIQEATIRHFCHDFCQNDEIIIFTTEGALNNWQEEEHWNPFNKKNEFYSSLKTRLESLNLKCSFRNENIKDGKTTTELWEIFEKVFGLLKPGDEITFDITHGFRTLPMFNMVLINYAKLLKNITVKGIYYGNWEARYESGDKVFSPIWDLKDFDLLQEWTNNANIFIKTGNAMPLASLIPNNNHSEIKEGLENFSKFILVNRGMDILKGETMLNLKNALNNYEEEKQNSPLNPIITKIIHEFDNYEEDNPMNGFLAARWAIKNGLIQQAATLMEEAVTTFVLYEIGQKEHVTDFSKRMKTSAAIVIGSNKEFQHTNPDSINPNEKDSENKLKTAQENLVWEKEFIPAIRNLPYKKKLASILSGIKNSIRNDINHAGYREKPQSFDELVESTSKRYNELRKLLLLIKKVELPEITTTHAPQSL